MRHTKICGN